MATNYFDFLSDYNLDEYGINNISIGINIYGNTHYCNFNKNEIYDIASLTKLFTLNLLYDLNINLNDSISKFLDTKLEVSILDLIQMKCYFKLDKNLNECNNYDEIKNILLSAKLLEKRYNYNDIAFCILGVLIEDISKKSLKENFENLFRKYNLHNTKILPINYSILSNGNSNNLPHDKKSQIMNGISGAAGIFSNCEDILKYCNLIVNFNIFDKEFINNIFDLTWVDARNRNRSYAGLYKYSTDKSSYVKNNSRALAHQGYTGSWLLMDFDNKNAAVISVDAINKNTLEKHSKFFEVYHPIITKVTNLIN